MSILDFDPRSLVQPDQNATSSFDENVYKCNPKLSKSEDGHYRSVIKVVYNPHDLAHSIVDRQVYSLNDENGWFEAVSALSDGSFDCPIFKAWLPLHKSKNPEEVRWSNPEYKGGTGWFQKRNERWVTIQVIEDKNQPDLEGKFMLFKLPTFIYKLIENKQSPAVESGKPSIPVMDFLIGRAIELEVTPGPDDPSDPTRKNREIKYDLSTLSEEPVACTNPDKSPILDAEQEEIVEKYLSALKKIWKERDIEKRNEMYTKLAEADITKKFSEFYDNTVINAIKQVCPNVYEDKRYKPWSKELTERVDKWLTKVTKGIDPVQVVNTDLENAAVQTQPTVETKKAEEKFVAVAPKQVTSAPDEDDELPF